MPSNMSKIAASKRVVMTDGERALSVCSDTLARREEEIG